jgi:hypothetical protein
MGRPLAEVPADQLRDLSEPSCRARDGMGEHARWDSLGRLLAGRTRQSGGLAGGDREEAIAWALRVPALKRLIFSEVDDDWLPLEPEAKPN